MKPGSIRTIAGQVPTTNEELTGLGVLGENIIKEYGVRLLRAVNNFIEKEGLEDVLSQKRPTKKVKVDTKKKRESFDEFATDVDFDSIDIP
jgi:hypothetical protein